MHRNEAANFDYAPPLDPFLPVVHADDDLIVIDKPSGLLSVPGKDPRLSDCVASRAVVLFPDALIVHRLDKDTSGLMVLGRNKHTQGRLGFQFEHRQVQKTYQARVTGDIEGETGLIDLPIATDPERRPRQKIDHERGRAAQTRWQVLAREGTATRLRLFPLTGRSHQLRLHLLALGHPILGDAFYAEGDVLAAANRLQLHAEMLAFTHPRDGRACRFESPCPF